MVHESKTDGERVEAEKLTGIELLEGRGGYDLSIKTTQRLAHMQIYEVDGRLFKINASSGDATKKDLTMEYLGNYI